MTLSQAALLIRNGAEVYIPIRLTDDGETLNLQLCKTSILWAISKDPDRDDAEIVATVDYDGDLILGKTEN
jgi:hypothetical protein